MKFEKLNMRANGNDDISPQVIAVLNQINGVLDVEIQGSSGECRILFDDKLVTFEEIKMTISNCGASIEQASHGTNGVCCGSCGGV